MEAPTRLVTKLNTKSAVTKSRTAASLLPPHSHQQTTSLGALTALKFPRSLSSPSVTSFRAHQACGVRAVVLPRRTSSRLPRPQSTAQRLEHGSVSLCRGPVYKRALNKLSQREISSLPLLQPLRDGSGASGSCSQCNATSTASALAQIALRVLRYAIVSSQNIWMASERSPDVTSRAASSHPGPHPRQCTLTYFGARPSAYRTRLTEYRHTDYLKDNKATRGQTVGFADRSAHASEGYKSREYW